MRIGVGALPSLHSCRNFSLLNGRNCLNCEKRLIPSVGRLATSAAACVLITISLFSKPPPVGDLLGNSRGIRASPSTDAVKTLYAYELLRLVRC